MIKHRLNTHCLHELVKALRGRLLKEGVLLPVTADTVDHIVSSGILFHHAVNRVDVILKVRIHRDGYVTLLLHGHKSGKECVLMSAVTAQTDAAKKRVLFMQSLNNGPRRILRTVVHKDDLRIA